MADIRLEIEENVEPVDRDAPVLVLAPRLKYRVTAEGGLFKNGKQYAQGDEIELDEITAGRFKELGDIEDGE